MPIDPFSVTFKGLSHPRYIQTPNPAFNPLDAPIAPGPPQMDNSGNPEFFCNQQPPFVLFECPSITTVNPLANRNQISAFITTMYASKTDDTGPAANALLTFEDTDNPGVYIHLAEITIDNVFNLPALPIRLDTDASVGDRFGIWTFLDFCPWGPLPIPTGPAVDIFLDGSVYSFQSAGS